MTLFIHGSGQEYPLTAREIARRFPLMSFPSDVALRNEAYLSLGYYPVVEAPKPLVNVATHIVREDMPVSLNETQYIQVWVSVPMTLEEKTQADNQQAVLVRADRDQLLAACDYTVLPDAPMKARSDEWVGYRQALRDITEQPSFPWDIVWPEPPV